MFHLMLCLVYVEILLGFFAYYTFMFALPTSAFFVAITRYILLLTTCHVTVAANQQLPALWLLRGLF